RDPIAGRGPGGPLDARVAEDDSVAPRIERAHVKLVGSAFDDRHVGQTIPVWGDGRPSLDGDVVCEPGFAAVGPANPELRGAQAAANEDDASVARDSGLAVGEWRRREPFGIC